MAEEGGLDYSSDEGLVYDRRAVQRLEFDDMRLRIEEARRDVLNVVESVREENKREVADVAKQLTEKFERQLEEAKEEIANGARDAARR